MARRPPDSLVVSAPTPKERLIDQPADDDRILPVTRRLAITIVPFLLVAFVVLYPVPTSTESWFAWGIKPTMTTMVLGAVYLGGAYFFVRAAMADGWHTIKVGFVPVGTFASLLGIVTILHWNKFNHDHVAFWLWAGLYFTTPLLVFGVWLANRRHDTRAAADDLTLSRNGQLAAAAVGILALTFGLTMFLAPDWAISVWPWTLTALTARTLGAIFALGVAGLGVFTDPRWSTVRLMVQVEGLMLLLISVAAIRARNEFDASNPLTWILAVGFAAVLAGSAMLWLRMEGRVAGMGETSQAR